MTGDLSARHAAGPDGGDSPGGSRPVIGISAYAEQARWRHWNLPAVLLPSRYCDAVVRAGGVPVLLPPVDGIEHSFGRLDGLIISGGPDVDPGRYGEQPGPHTMVLRPDRDASEFALVSAALQQRTPVLGVCRGMQVLNVALGGTLLQHLPDVVGHEEHGPLAGAMGAHDVAAAPGSRLAGLMNWAAAGGQLRASVPTHHHQGIDKLAAGLTAVAWAADGVIEAVEFDASEHPFALGVQWHPEAGDDPGLFRALVAAARRLQAQSS
jgi:putative glutamine amidotransferase